MSNLSLDVLIQQKMDELQALKRLQDNEDFKKVFGNNQQFAKMLSTGAPTDIVSITPMKPATIELRTSPSHVPEDLTGLPSFIDGELVLPPRAEKVKINTAPSGQHRRIKQGVDKKPVKERELLPEERSEIIALMNKRQDLLPHDEGNGDGVCQKMCDKFNRKNPRLERVYPYQISGYYSHLCRMALKPAVERNGWFEAACKLEKVLPNVKPVWSASFIKKVAANLQRNKKDEAQMRQDHHVIIDERKKKGVI